MNTIPGTSPNIQSVLSALYTDDKDKHYGLPFQVWKKEYDDNADLLIEEIIKPLTNHCSNTTLYGGLYNNTYNPLNNYDKYNGDFTSQGDVYQMLYLYGDYQGENEERMRDFNFYWYAVSRIKSDLNRHDLRFTVDIVNREAGLMRKERLAKTVAEAQIRGALSMVKQQTATDPEQNDGEDFSFARDKEVYVPTRVEELNELMNDKEVSSSQTYDLLNHNREKYNLKRELNDKNLEDKCKINACMGMIDINNENDPEYRRLHPSNVTWIGPQTLGANGFDDCDAVQITELVPVTKALLKDRGLHGANLSTANKIIDKIKEFKKNELKQEAPVRPMITDMQQWGQYWYYKPGTGMYVCRQHIFFKMLHPRRVKLTIKGRNLTEDELKDFQNYGSNKEDIDFKVVDEDYKESAAETMMDIPIVKTHEAIRYGEDAYILVREYPNQLRKSNNWINSGYPLTACVWEDKSIVTLGTDFAYIYHASFKKLSEEIKNLKVGEMLNFDIDTLGDGYTPEMIPLMIRDGLNLYSGSKMTGQVGGKESYRHLTTTKTSVSPNELIALLNLGLIAANTWYKMLGIPYETNLIQKLEAANKDQEAPVQGSMALLSFYNEFIEDYTNQVLQKLADIGRYAWSRDKSKTVFLGGGKTKNMKIDPSIMLDEQGIFVLNDYKSRKDKEFILNAGFRALATGGVTFGELIKMYHSENPERIQAMFNEGMSVLDKLRAQDQKIKQQGVENQAKFNEMKLQVPIMVQKEITDRTMRQQQMIEENKDEREAAKMEMKGESSDISHAQSKEIKQLETNLEIDKASKIPEKV